MINTEKKHSFSINPMINTEQNPKPQLPKAAPFPPPPHFNPRHLLHPPPFRYNTFLLSPRDHG